MRTAVYIASIFGMQKKVAIIFLLVSTLGYAQDAVQFQPKCSVHGEEFCDPALMLLQQNKQLLDSSMRQMETDQKSTAAVYVHQHSKGLQRMLSNASALIEAASSSGVSLSLADAEHMVKEQEHFMMDGRGVRKGVGEIVSKIITGKAGTNGPVMGASAMTSERWANSFASGDYQAATFDIKEAAKWAPAIVGLTGNGPLTMGVIVFMGILVALDPNKESEPPSLQQELKEFGEKIKQELKDLFRKEMMQTALGEFKLEVQTILSEMQWVIPMLEIKGKEPLLISGKCKKAKFGLDTCVTSPNYPGSYPHNAKCEIAWPAGARLKVVEFKTEKHCDKVKIGKHYYHGEQQGQQGYPPSEIQSVSDGKVSFSSDGSITKKGFKLCLPTEKEGSESGGMTEAIFYFMIQHDLAKLMERIMKRYTIRKWAVNSVEHKRFRASILPFAILIFNLQINVLMQISSEPKFQNPAVERVKSLVKQNKNWFTDAFNDLKYLRLAGLPSWTVRGEDKYRECISNKFGGQRRRRKCKKFTWRECTFWGVPCTDTWTGENACNQANCYAPKGYFVGKLSQKGRSCENLCKQGTTQRMCDPGVSRLLKGRVQGELDKFGDAMSNLISLETSAADPSKMKRTLFLKPVSVSATCQMPTKEPTPAPTLPPPTAWGTRQQDKYCSTRWTDSWDARIDGSTVEDCKSRCQADSSCKGINFSVIQQPGNVCILCTRDRNNNGLPELSPAHPGYWVAYVNARACTMHPIDPCLQIFGIPKTR